MRFRVLKNAFTLRQKCASDAEEEKIKKYADVYKCQGHEFVPFALESFGAFGPRIVSVFNILIAHVYAANVHMPLSFIKQYWMNRIVMALQSKKQKKALGRVRCGSGGFERILGSAGILKRDSFWQPQFTDFN
jgi:hypothetical protein